MEEVKIKPMTGSLGKKVLIKDLMREVDNIKSVSTIYQNIDKEKKYKITIFISEELRYEN